MSFTAQFGIVTGFSCDKTILTQFQILLEVVSYVSKSVILSKKKNHQTKFFDLSKWFVAPYIVFKKVVGKHLSRLFLTSLKNFFFRIYFVNFVFKIIMISLDKSGKF